MPYPKMYTHTHTHEPRIKDPFMYLPVPPELDDEAAENMCDFLYEMCLLFESHYSDQIRRHHRQITLLWQEAALSLAIQDDEEDEEDEEENEDFGFLASLSPFL